MSNEAVTFGYVIANLDDYSFLRIDSTLEGDIRGDKGAVRYAKVIRVHKTTEATIYPDIETAELDLHGEVNPIIEQCVDRGIYKPHNKPSYEVCELVLTKIKPIG